MRKCSTLPLLILVVLLVSSCQRELAELKLEKGECRVATGFYYGGSAGLYDSLVFSYDADKLTRAEGELNYATYTYSGSLITERKFYDKYSGELLNTTQIEYSGSTITKVSMLFYPAGFNPDTNLIVYTFSYLGNVIERITEERTLFDPSGPITETVINYFQSNASGNIENIVTRDAQGNLHDSVSYEYNAELNYFQPVHPHFILVDPYFILNGGFISQLPYFYSRNNVTKFVQYLTYEYPIAYEVDGSRNVTKVFLGGNLSVEYKYDCP